MSLKRFAKHKLQNLTNYVDSLALPAWVSGFKIRFGLIGLTVLLGVIYVGQISVAARSGYQMRDLEGQVSLLEADIQKLEVEIADYSSMSNIEQRLKDSGMVAVGKIKYFNTVDTVVAKR